MGIEIKTSSMPSPSTFIETDSVEKKLESLRRSFNILLSTLNGFSFLDEGFSENDIIETVKLSKLEGTLDDIDDGSTYKKMHASTINTLDGKLGFYGTAPASQPAHIADATDAADVITRVNLILADLATLGLQASS